jgi:hypothetical protein
MKPQSSSQGSPGTGAIRRLDRVLGEINIVLLALAIGLAALDATCFVAFRLTSEVLRPQVITASSIWSLPGPNADLTSLLTR